MGTNHQSVKSWTGVGTMSCNKIALKSCTSNETYYYDAYYYYYYY